MSQKIVVGSLVKLRSGSPWLTVTDDKPAGGAKKVGVTWFDGAAVSTGVFPKDALDVKEEAEGAASVPAAEKAGRKKAPEAGDAAE
ncbi:DUF2158 domain-containing protein [Paraburkholderia sp. UCT31]|uniref:DUF2158 domain-containing protein n=1 Tax=Paraburkholderia sp. UCT31 TaxID=2615209 RepID=UPI0016564686|nr:DUF2158 domain-containing protein [Paraburkholderia sp. UCT31]MBC8737373.1 DUF2158 domain-containing protein [Paraburkholderia sp. UCT31]